MSKGRTEPIALPGWTGELATALRPADLAAEVARLTDPGAALKTLHWGRNYLYVTRYESAAGPVEVVVKQFRNAGAKARLRRRLKGTKAERSWRVAQAYAAAGLLTPEPVIWLDSTREDGPSYYVCRYLPDVLEARYLFRAANEGREREAFPQVDFPKFLDELGRTVRRLHEAGIWHRDLSVGNVLLRPAPDGAPEALYLIDLNRSRVGPKPGLTERVRDLTRLNVLRPEHQERLLTAYWGQPPSALRRGLYRSYQGSFHLKNSAKRGLRSGVRKIAEPFKPRVAHAHIPAAPSDATARDLVVWDRLSDQPHQHAGRLTKLRVRAADAREHAAEAAAVAGALPRIWRRYRRLQRELRPESRRPVDWQGAGVCVRPWPEAPEALLELVEDLGARHVLLRLHPWDDGADRDAEEELARELHARGYELTFALPQNRELVKDPVRWRRALEDIGPRFTRYGARYQIGQAINRSKWGIWNQREFVELARAAEEILRREAGVELLGPSVIDFEYHVTAAVLNLREPGFHFDAVSALLYVDRRGAPENPQAGFDTEGKVALLKAIAETARNSTGRCWITEVNWPLWEGPHSPAGRSVSVDEETQADYLVRYYLQTLGTGLVERVFWWQMIARGYGLVDPAASGELRRRPSYRAFQVLLRELEGCRLEETLTGPGLPPTARLYRFRAADGADRLVAWSTSGTAEVTLPRPVAQALGRDGQEIPGAGGGKLSLGASPCYLRLTP
ncbi:MAG TPA: lipopolysaccharide kinase InaA family protein [Thermoanaerobaculia bacterium]|nr:lipopolysaccharide kinase InaA family protein [Thermoanaerobaculia bacterium]